MVNNYVRKLKVLRKVYNLCEDKNLQLMKKEASSKENGLENETRFYQKEEFLNNMQRQTIRNNITNLLETDKNSQTNKMIKLLEKDYLLDEDKYNLVLLKDELELNEFEISLLREHINNYRPTDSKSLIDLRKELVLKVRRRNTINKTIRKLEPKVNAFRDNLNDYIKRIDN